MSGTSADGTDAAMIAVDPGAFAEDDPFLRLLGHGHLPYSKDLRDDALAAAADDLKPSALCILQRRLGESHAAAGRALVEQIGVQPDFASLHGQTIQHHPGRGATLQLADPYVLSEALACPVIWDLRRRDMALGGQGAPLVPLTELWLRGRSRPWAALNLGGIANITLWDGERIQAWDLGPAMSLLDLAALRWLGLPFDPEGSHALGHPAQDRLEHWMGHSYFRLAPPKSTGREVFGAAWLEAEAPFLETLPLEDRLATLAAFTAEACARELGRWAAPLPSGTPLWLSGGGARHRRLRRELEFRFPEWQLAEDRAFPPGAREAVSWALLGAASAAGVSGSLPLVTGACRGEILGSWTGRPSRQP
jgi:anhydro-N-acetylmuramic acid kinase